MAMKEEAQMKSDEESTLSLQWEEISECKSLSWSSLYIISPKQDGSKVGGQSNDDDDDNTTYDGHWEVTSMCSQDGVNSRSSHFLIDWTYRDALLCSSNGVVTTSSSLVTTTTFCLSQKRNPERTHIPKHLIIQQQRTNDPKPDEMNGHLLNLDEDQCCYGKPMSDKQRRKFDQAGRRRLLCGHTGRYYDDWFYKHYGEVILEFSDPHLSGVELPLDKKLGKVGSHCPWETEWSLNKNKAWDRVPEILEAEALEIEKVKLRPRNWVRGDGTIYRLPLDALKQTKLCREVKKTKAFSDYERYIYYKPQHRPAVYSRRDRIKPPRTVFAELSMGPPENVEDELISWTLRNRNRNRKREAAMINGWAALFVEDGQLLPGTQRRFFEIDLRETHIVTAISTQGCLPPVRTYPLDSDLTFPLGHNGWHYEGPKWLVYDPDWKFLIDDRCKQRRWVRSYEVQALLRSECGSCQWQSLGFFNGNNDATTERAVTFASMGILKVVACRFLRIIPVDCENGGALRIGIYGKKQGRDNTKPSTVLNTDDQHLVEYTLSQPMKLIAKHADGRDGFAYRWKRRWKGRWIETYRARPKMHDKLLLSNDQ